MNTNYVYPSAQVGEFRNAMLYASGPASYAVAGDAVYNPGSSEYINFPSNCRTLSGNYDVRFIPTAVGLNQIRAGGGVAGPSASGWTAIWEYAGGSMPVAGIPLTLGTLSAAATTSAFSANGVLTVVVANSLKAGQFVVLSGGASAKSIFLNGVLLQVVTASATQFTANYAPAKSLTYASASDTGLKFQVVQAASGNPLQAVVSGSAVTSVTVASNVLTVAQNNTFSVGQFVVLQGLVAGEIVQGAIVQIVTASSTGWTANVQAANLSVTSGETGTAALLVTNGTAPVTSAIPAAITNTLAVAADATDTGLLTLTAQQNDIPGQLIVVQGVTTRTALNGSIATVIATSLTNQLIKANGWTAAVSTSADNGTAALLVTGSPANGNQVSAGTNLSAEQVQFAALVSSL